MLPRGELPQGFAFGAASSLVSFREKGESCLILEELEEPQRGDFREDFVRNGPDTSNYLLQEAIPHYCFYVQDSSQYLFY